MFGPVKTRGAWRIGLGLLMIVFFGVALIDRLRHDESWWKIGSAVLLVVLGVVQVLNGVQERRGPTPEE